ncbi:MAG: DUF4838 domain-containing protein, partial [Armatimonadetes bacterium]|nr:DUF4838 domain-containing protein [Armatimonadota bacterium]
ADLYVVGGRPRGTLYAAYHFLEDVVGVHWWTPWDESAPKRQSVRVGKISLHGKPAFRYRDIYMLFGSDEGRFAARNRLNRDGDSPIHARYGGSMAYGPPYHVHTAYSFFPPRDHFAQHPEWYSLINGKRTSENAQLCWTDPGLRDAFRSKLLETIRKSWADARAAGEEPPLVFSVSQNDCYGACQCERCQALAKSEGSEAGPLLDFVNAMADAVKAERPEVFLDTLAYQYTQTAPKTIRPRDNVIIRLCDTEADMIAPITAPQNRAFREHILSWARIAKNLRVWDYAVTYGTPGTPLPTVHTFGPDLRYYAAHNVEGVFTELEYEVLADMRDFKVWTLMKTLEDPAADLGKLTDTFMKGFYGPAGVWVKRYVRALEAEAALRKASSTCWQGSAARLSYLTAEFISRAQRIFAHAEKAAAHDPELARRVAHARLPLDRATLMLWPKLQDALPGLDRDAVGRRALAAWLHEIDRRIPVGRRPAERLGAEGEIQRLTLAPAKTGLPTQFRGRPKGSVVDYTAAMTRNWNNVVKVVKDPEAETGITNRLDLTAPDVERPERYVLPMPWGLYIPDQKRALDAPPIKASDIHGPGYHWYKLGEFPVAPSTYVWFFWSWIIQVDIENAADPKAPSAQFEVWARVKLEGPRFPHARPGQTDAICVERVILVRKG